MKKNLAVLSLWLLATGSLLSCKKETAPEAANEPSQSAQSKKGDAEKSNVFKGPNVALGNGKARTWIRITHSGVPLEMGVEMTPQALTGLPMGHDHSAPGNTSLVLPLHQKAQAITTFDHIGLDWNPQGHPPAFLFMAPHFDVHFYMMSVQERMAIPAYTPNSAFDILPPAGYMPSAYAPGPGGEARMGKHWSLPPDQIAPFTRTMILGTYNGQFTFLEPMVTLEYLMSGATSNLMYAQPTKFARSGYYPTMYNIYRDADGNHQITLSGFVYRTAS